MTMRKFTQKSKKDAENAEQPADNGKAQLPPEKRPY